MAYVIGVDGGTESVRAHVFDLSGHCLGSAASAYPTSFGTDGSAEQDPRDWWKSLGEAVRGAVARAGVAVDEIRALGVDTTSCTVVALDEDGAPLRPAILWMDVRAVEEADAVLATGDAALRMNCAGEGPVSAEWMIPKALWLKRHQPAIFARAATIAEYQDYMMLRLTGRRVASLTNCGMRWHYRSDDGGWPDAMLAALDLGDLREKWPDTVLAPGVPVEFLTAGAADHLGLRRSTLVVQGGADAFIGMIGLGVSRPGQLGLVTGSSHLQLAVSERSMAIPGIWGSYADIVYPGRHVVEGGQSSSGSAVAWLGRLFGIDAEERERLNDEAADIEPGCDGLMALDHFQGNRMPHTDARSRGALVGLTIGHGRAHIHRAIIEAICMGTRAILDRMRAADVPMTRMIAGGGATNSSLWLQIHADTSGLPVDVPRFTDVPALGAAVLAAVGADFVPNIDVGIEAMVAVDRTVEPDVVAVRRYDELYQGYSTLYPSLRAWRRGTQA